MPYNPGRFGDIDNWDDLRRFLETELDAISKNFNEQTAVDLRTVHVEPERPREGMLAAADGSDWDPGDGQGTYEYVGGAWRKLGIADGDYGDIVISGGNFSIDANVVTTTKLADMPQATVIGRQAAAGTGDPAYLTSTELWDVIRTKAQLNVKAVQLHIEAQGGNEGGEYSMARPASGTNLASDISFDIAVDRYRIFESGGTNRGCFVDLTACETGAGRDLLKPLRDSGVVNLTGASVAITNIALGKIIMVSVRDASHNSGSNQAFRIELSDNNGASWGGVLVLTATASSAVDWDGLITIMRADIGSPQVSAIFTGTAASTTSYTLAGAVNAMRLSVSGGSFDAGNANVISLP